MSRGRHGTGRQLVGWIGVLLLVALGCSWLFHELAPRANFDAISAYADDMRGGWWLTLGLSLGALLLSIVLAPLWCAMLMSPIDAIRYLATALTELVRGTPLLVQLLLVYYVIAAAAGVDSRLGVGVAVLAGYTSVYLGEMLRGGIRSIDQTQRLAARAVGFSRRQEFLIVVLPQALRRILPAVVGSAVNLVKDSSLLSVIGVLEFTKRAQVANTLTFSDFEAYIPLALGYLAVTIPLALLARALERRMHHAS